MPDPSPILAGINATQDLVIVGVCGLLVTVYFSVRNATKERRGEKAVIAGKDKTALEQVAEGVKRLEGAVFDRPPSLAEPEGHKGIQTQVAVHGAILRRMMPNGGDTDEPGDLLLKLARDRGLLEDPS